MGIQVQIRKAVKKINQQISQKMKLPKISLKIKMKIKPMIKILQPPQPQPQSKLQINLRMKMQIKSKMIKRKKIKKMVQKKNKIDIPLKEEFIPQMDESSFQIWRKEELTMIAKDKEIRETEELRNSLEGYVLEMRGRLEGSLGQYMKDNAREKFIKELNDMEEWLYEDGYDAEKSAFEDRLKSLKLSGDPVDRRSNEAKRRPEVIRSMNRAIAESKALAQSKDKKYDHIPAEDREKAMKQCKETEEWLKNELKKQDPLTLADDPVVLCDAIERKKGDTIRYCQTIMNKPKPEP